MFSDPIQERPIQTLVDKGIEHRMDRADAGCIAKITVQLKSQAADNLAGRGVDRDFHVQAIAHSCNLNSSHGYGSHGENR